MKKTSTTLTFNKTTSATNRSWEAHFKLLVILRFIMYSASQDIATLKNMELHSNVCCLMVESTTDWPKNTDGFITIHKMYQAQYHPLQQPLWHQQPGQQEVQQKIQGQQPDQDAATMINVELRCNVCNLIVESTSDHLCYDSRDWLVDWSKNRNSENNFIDKMGNTDGFITIHKIYKAQDHPLQQSLCHQQPGQQEIQQPDQQNWGQDWQQQKPQLQKPQQQDLEQQLQQQKPQQQEPQKQKQSQEQHVLLEKVNLSMVSNEEEEEKENVDLTSEKYRKIKAEKHKWIKNGSQSAKPLVCDFCYKSFTTTGYLKQHYNSKHSEAKPFKCDLCGKNFSNETIYTKHMAMHFNKKKYQCDKCDKQYAHPTDLKRHKYTHSDTKPYSCSQCNHSFARNDHLIAHQRKHLTHKKKLQKVRYI